MSLRLTGQTRRGKACKFLFGAMQVDAYLGETVAAALIASGQRAFRTDSQHQGRGPYCNMGTCFECVLEIRTATGWQTARACLMPVSEGLQLRPLNLKPDIET